MTHKSRVLILDDEPDVLKQVVKWLSNHFSVTGVTALDDARHQLLTAAPGDYSVAVLDMRLPDEMEGGLVLLQELNKYSKRPEVVILTAYPDFDNASQCMQAGAFAYVEKGKADTYDQLEKVCIAANKRWYRTYRLIGPEMLDQPIALLFGDFAYIDFSEEYEPDSTRQTLHSIVYRDVPIHDGYLVKVTDHSFLAIFNTPSKAIKAARSIQDELWTVSSLGATMSLPLRQSVHWGQVNRIRIRERDDIVGPEVVACVQSVEQASPGEVIISSQAREVLDKSTGEDRQLPKQPQPNVADNLTYQKEDEIRHSKDMTDTFTRTPEWVTAALEVAKRIEAMGLDLPSDLAERHDHYAHGKSV